jgi:hypothetical protein
MKALTILFFLAATPSESQDILQEEMVRYILIEAPCKPGFPGREGTEKVILTKVFERRFENPFELVNAEPELITDFEVILEEAYPDSRNQVKDILVYMISSEKEAKDLYHRKIKQFKMLDAVVIELKMK